MGPVVLFVPPDSSRFLVIMFSSVNWVHPPDFDVDVLIERLSNVSKKHCDPFYPVGRVCLTVAIVLFGSSAL